MRATVRVSLCVFLFQQTGRRRGQQSVMQQLRGQENKKRRLKRKGNGYER